MIGAIVCFLFSGLAAVSAFIGYLCMYQNKPFVTSDQVAIAQRWTMLAGFFAWFGYNLMP